MVQVKMTAHRLDQERNTQPAHPHAARAVQFMGAAATFGFLLTLLTACSKKPPPAAEGDGAAATPAPLSSSAMPGVPPAAERAVRGYLSHDDCREQVKYIVNSSVNGPIILSDYAKRAISTCKWPITAIEGSSSDNCDRAAVGAWCFVNVTFSDAPALGVELQRTPSGFLVDWRSTVGENPMTFAAFKASRPKQPTILRVWAKLDSFYARGFPEKNYYSFYLSDSKHKAHLWAYQKRSGAERIFDVLKDGKEHAVMLDVVHREDASSDQVSVERVIDLTWHENPEEFAGVRR